MAAHGQPWFSWNVLLWKRLHRLQHIVGGWISTYFSFQRKGTQAYHEFARSLGYHDLCSFRCLINYELPRWRNCWYGVIWMHQYGISQL